MTAVNSGRAYHRGVWMSARYAGTCACGAAIHRGMTVFYSPQGHRVECRACAADHWVDTPAGRRYSTAQSTDGGGIDGDM